jgi:hypothetical protein
MVRRTGTILLLLIAAGLPSCEAMTMPQNDTCGFDKIVPGVNTSNSCTPTVDDQFVGIAINAPSVVTYGRGKRDRETDAFARIIVAGVCLLPTDSLNLGGRWNKHITLVAIDSRTKRVFTGKIGPRRAGYRLRSDDEPRMGDFTSGSSNSKVGTFFNSNLASDLFLPGEDADYDVHAVLGPFRSNVVHIKVRRR